MKNGLDESEPKTERIMVRIEPSLKARADAMARATGRSVGSFVRVGLASALADLELILSNGGTNE